MKLAYLGSIVVVASMLAACGGAASPSTAAPPLVPVPTNGASPAAMTYVQSATATSTGAAPLFPGFTCSDPQTVRTASANGTISQTTAANQSFNGQSGLYAVTSTISLQGCADGPETVSETDYFHLLAVSGNISTITVLVGSTVSYATYVGMPRNVVVSYGPNGLIAGELPMQAGRMWTNTAARTMTSTWGNQQETLTVNADGSYTDSTIELQGIFPYDSTVAVENPDASGTVTQVAGANASAPPFGASLSAPSGTTVVITPFGQAPLPPDAPTPTPCPGSCPAVTPTPYPQYAWYPYDPSASKPLETLTTTDEGVVALPSTCNVPAPFPASAELIETVDTVLDVFSGTASETSDAYVDPHDGVLCLNVALQQASYVFGATSADTTPVSTGTLTFSESLQTENSPPAVLAVPTLARLGVFWR